MIQIDLPWPPSVNHYWRTPRTGALAGRTLISEEGRAYRNAVNTQVTLQRARHHITNRIRVEIEAFMPDRRRRDLDNLPKSVLDSLTHAGVWQDDAQIDDLRIYRAPTIAGMLKVRIWPMGDATCSES